MLKNLKDEFDPKKVDEYWEMVEKPLAKDSEIDRVEIIVLKYKDPKTETKCVKNLLENTEHPYKLTLFDNRPNSANMAKAWNKLIRESTCEYIVVMDSDAFVGENWLAPLVNCFKDKPDCGIAVPVAGDTSVPVTQQRRKRLNEGPLAITGHVSGFCFMIKKSMMEEMGWFDENFYVFGQDSDFCERMLHAKKYRPYIVAASYVEHGEKEGGSTSTRKASEEGDWFAVKAFLNDSSATEIIEYDQYASALLLLGEANEKVASLEVKLADELAALRSEAQAESAARKAAEEQQAKFAAYRKKFEDAPEV